MKATRERIAQATALLANESGSTEVLPSIADVPSLVLNRDHVLSDLYYKRAPYKVYWGGRGSAKSWAFAEALIRFAAAGPIRVLCCREHQNSIKDSSHKLLKDTITRLGLDSWFTVTKESITSRAGAEFMFKGLYNNEEGIKSTEGIDYCWVEEAQTVTAGSWRTLIPTIRKDTAEIWVSYNLINEEDATHQMFVVRGRTGAIVHKVNYDSNPYFSGKLRQDMEDDKRTDYHLYEHIWLGMPLKVSSAIILSGKYVVEEFDDKLWTQADRRRIGMDFGFAQDPQAVVSFFVLDDCLYIERESFADRRFKGDPARPQAPASITSYILPGLGYGGSCFPKDTEALTAWARERQVETPLLDAVRAVNATRPDRVVSLLRRRLQLAGARVAVLGLAFKPETDDLRESRSLDLARLLHAAGAEVRGCDPVAAEEGRALLAGVATVTADPEAALAGADAAVLATAWPSLVALDPARVRQLMRRPLVLDARRGLDPAAWAAHCEYLPIGVKA